MNLSKHTSQEVIGTKGKTTTFILLKTRHVVKLPCE